MGGSGQGAGRRQRPLAGWGPAVFTAGSADGGDWTCVIECARSSCLTGVLKPAVAAQARGGGHEYIEVASERRTTNA